MTEMTAATTIVRAESRPPSEPTSSLESSSEELLVGSKETIDIHHRAGGRHGQFHPSGMGMHSVATFTEQALDVISTRTGRPTWTYQSPVVPTPPVTSGM